MSSLFIFEVGKLENCPVLLAQLQSLFLIGHVAYLDASAID